MLKFADLKVDFNSFENSLNSFMKMFPGSYTPLLITYLAHEGLLKLVTDFDYSDSRVIVGVEPFLLKEFFGDSFFKDLLQDEITYEEKDTPEDIIKKISNSIVRDRDLFVMLPFITLAPYLIEKEPVALVADIEEGDELEDIINIILSTDHAKDNPAALLYYSLVLMDKFEKLDIPITSDYDNLSAGDDVDLNEIAEANDRSEMSYWIRDFEYVLDKIQSYSNEKDCSQPKEITNVILTQCKKGGSIYNPFAGLASYNVQRLVEFMVDPINYLSSYNIGDYYYGEEINDLTWAIGKLRLLAYHADSKNYILGDSTHWRGGTANNVFSTPPFGVKIVNEEGKDEYTDSYVIRRGMYMLADDGLLACVVPWSFLYREDAKYLRKKIVESGWLESIVYLPEKIFSYTNIRTAIIFIRKTVHRSVVFVNATMAVINGKSKQNTLDQEMVANLLHHNYFPTYYYYDSDGRIEEDLPEALFERLRIVQSNEQIVKCSYNFSPGNYFLDSVIPPSEGFKTVQLSRFINGEPKNVGTKGIGKVIRTSMLSSDPFTPLMSSDIPGDNYKPNYKVIDQDAVLISTSSLGKQTLLKIREGDKVYYDPALINAFYLKPDTILPEYLLLELVKQYVKEQVQLLSEGDALPRLKPSHILLISIQIPIKSRQALKIEKGIVDDAKTLYYSKINAELVTLKDKQHSDYIKMLRQRKHRIQQVMNEFGPAFALLDECRVENGGVLHSGDIVAARTGETVENYFIKLRNIEEKLESLITNLVDKEHWDIPQKVEIISFLNRIPENHVSDKFKFQVLMDKVNESLVDVADGISLYVKICEHDLSTIFDNIIANAAKWGFTENNRNDYRIRIELSFDEIDNKEAVNICVSNNGTPIHKSVDRNRFFEWGYGSGSGIGTWQLKDIIEHYGGIIRLNEYPDDIAGFQTEYEIVLPLNNE